MGLSTKDSPRHLTRPWTQVWKHYNFTTQIEYNQNAQNKIGLLGLSSMFDPHKCITLALPLVLTKEDSLSGLASPPPRILP